MISGPVSRGCREPCLILIVTAGKTQIKIDRSFQPLPESRIDRNHSYYIQLLYRECAIRWADNEVWGMVRVRSHQVYAASEQLAVNQRDDEGRLTFDSFDFGPIERDRIGHVVCFDLELTALQPLYLSRDPIAILQNNHIVIPGIGGRYRD